MDRKPPAEKRKRVRIERGLFQRTSDGAYEVGFTGSDGRYRLETLRGPRTLGEARKAARSKLTQRDAGEDVAPSKLTFDQLAEDFFASFESKTKTGERSARSLEDYRRRYRVHLKARLGRVQAQSISR